MMRRLRRGKFVRKIVFKQQLPEAGHLTLHITCLGSLFLRGLL